MCCVQNNNGNIQTRRKCYLNCRSVFTFYALKIFNLHLEKTYIFEVFHLQICFLNIKPNTAYETFTNSRQSIWAIIFCFNNHISDKFIVLDEALCVLIFENHSEVFIYVYTKGAKIGRKELHLRYTTVDGQNQLNLMFGM